MNLLHDPTFEIDKTHAEDLTASPYTATAVVMIDNQDHNQNQNHRNSSESLLTYTDAEDVCTNVPYHNNGKKRREKKCEISVLI